MADLLLELAAFLKEPGKVTWSLVLAGTALIVINLVTHRLLAWFDSRARRREQVVRSLRPLLRSTADLISRLVEILITHKEATIDAVRKYSPKELDERISTVLQSAADLNRHETTAYRLINYLTLAHCFGRETAGIAPISILDRAEYFIQHKVAVGLRGNLYNLSLLGTEVQEDIARAGLSCCSPTQPGGADLSPGILLSKLKDRSFPREFFRQALDFVGLIPPYAGHPAQIDRNKQDWQHTLALAHWSIYLIDFYQELAQDPQWEEHRVLFVKLVREWNAGALKHLYLYEPGDLEGKDYLRTFPTRRTSRDSSLYAIPSIPLLGAALGRLKMWSSLNIRGARFGRRHHPKRLKRWGVRIKSGKAAHDVRWDRDFQATYESVRSWLKERLLKM